MNNETLMTPEFEKFKQDFAETVRKDLMAQYDAGSKDVLHALIKAFDTMTEAEMDQILSFRQLKADLVNYRDKLFPTSSEAEK